jgi:hypothetical protein
MRISKQSTLVLAAAVLTSCVGLQTVREAKAVPLIYAPSAFPFMTVDVARAYVGRQLVNWQTVNGPIIAARVKIDRIEVADKRGRMRTLVLENLDLVDIANRTIQVGDTTLTGGKKTDQRDVRELADALKFLKHIAPYEPQAADVR